jgi:hypothetical protein
MADLPPKGKEEACKTYIEQTKLLVALASAFLAAPIAILGLFLGKDALLLIGKHQSLFLTAEGSFILSVLAGYVVLGALAGSQDDGSFDVYRLATRIVSWLQLISYLLGLIIFVYLIQQIGEQAQANNHAASSLYLEQIAEVGPFPDGEDCPSSIVSHPAISVAARAITDSRKDVIGLLVEGSADARMLNEKTRKAFGTNAGLAQSRAECIKKQLLTVITPIVDQDFIKTSGRGPSIVDPSTVNREELGKDRHVRVFLIKRVKQSR